MTINDKDQHFENNLLKLIKNKQIKITSNKKCFSEIEQEKINDTIKKASLVRKIETEKN